MVRDMARDKQHRWKLDPEWMGPWLLIDHTLSGVSGYVQELYNDNTKKYHLDDLKVYCKRDDEMNYTSIIKRNAMLYAGFQGQRAVNLHSPSYFM